MTVLPIRGTAASARPPAAWATWLRLVTTPPPEARAAFLAEWDTPRPHPVPRVPFVVGGVPYHGWLLARHLLLPGDQHEYVVSLFRLGVPGDRP